jgi:hypothetical protein
MRANKAFEENNYSVGIIPHKIKVPSIVNKKMILA